MRQMTMAVAAMVLCAPMAVAQGYEFVGYGNILNNDYYGDGRDRWQTGSDQLSLVWSNGWEKGWKDQLTSGFGDTIELRFGARVAAPDNIDIPANDDRRYAGVLSLGLVTHMAVAQDYQMALGAGVEAVGPGTALDEFHAKFHSLIGSGDASAAVRDNQIGDKITPYASFEMARAFPTGGNSRIRPFVEAHSGLETLARVGVDFHVGDLTLNGLMSRDYVTGQTYQTVRGTGTGWTFIGGADVAKVTQSALLPSDDYTLTPARVRARVAVQWAGNYGVAQFGLTYLGKEFEQQDSGQVLGSISFKYDF